MVVTSLSGEIEASYAPQIVVEICSPENSLKKLRDKAKYYLAHGTRMVVLIYPDKQIVEVQTADEHDLFTRDDVIDGRDLLPGFKLPVRDLFP